MVDALDRQLIDTALERVRADRAARTRSDNATMRAYRVLFFTTSVFLASVGCQQTDSLQNAATLQRIGFQTFGNGFYFKPGIFLVKVDQAGRVSSIITPLDLHGFPYLESDGRYKAIAMAPKSQSQERELRLFDENGDCFQVPVSGDGQGPCNDPPPSALFTADESATRTPLKARLAKIARKVAPNVYTIADPGEAHRDFYAVYDRDRLIFTGNSQAGQLSPKTKILGYHRRKDEWGEYELGALELEGAYLRYELASNGYMVTGSAKQLKEGSVRSDAGSTLHRNGAFRLSCRRDQHQ
jgi:hypothetical protein